MLESEIQWSLSTGLLMNCKLTFSLSFLWGDEDRPLAVLYLHVRGHHAELLLQDLNNKHNVSYNVSLT